MYISYHAQVRSGARIPESNDWDRGRTAAESTIHPNYHEDICYSALSLDVWANDRALRLVLVALDEAEPDDENKRDALTAANELLAKEKCFESVANQFYAKPLTESTRKFVLEEFQPFSRVHALLTELLQHQVAIARLRDAWLAIPRDLFKSDVLRDRFQNAVIAKGVCRGIAQAMRANSSALEFAILRALNELRGHARSRIILEAWLKDFRTPAVKRLVPLDDEEPQRRTEQPARRLNADATLRNVLVQQDAIIRKLHENDLVKARSFARELVQSQLATGDAEHVSKSLCRLAQEAKRLGMHSLQLEWATKAVELNPEDGWAHGQAADAYLEYFRLDEAAYELDLSEAYDGRFFTATARARLHRIRGDYERALQGFRKARSDFAGADDEAYAWSGAAETLRAMFRFEEALQEYEEAIEKLPFDAGLICGKASILVELGRLEEADAAYESATRLLADSVALNGRATVLKITGRLKEALDLYEKTVSEYPHDPAAGCGRADVLRVMGRLNEAFSAYEDITRRFPHLPVAYSGRAEVLRFMGRFADALVAYDAAVDRFPFEPILANGRANLLLSMGRTKESLAAYDEINRALPSNLFAKVGRGNLLRRLGDYQNALAVYSDIQERWPAFDAARNAKAALLVVMNDLAEADKILPASEPRTQGDWVAYRIRGNLLARRQLFAQASEHFLSGMERTPFGRERQLMHVAWASLQLHGGAIPQIERDDLEKEEIANVVRFHAMAASGDSGPAKSFFGKLKSRQDSLLIELTDEIAASFNVVAWKPRHDRLWILQAELDAVMLLEAA